MSNEASREAFEAWCAASNQKYHPTDDGLSNRQDWQTWQAGRKALEAEQALAVEPVAHFNMAINETVGCIAYEFGKHGLKSGTPLFLHPTPLPAPSLTEALSEKGITLRTEFEPKPRDTTTPPVASTERAELIARHRGVQESGINAEMRELAKTTADMLEADAPQRDKQWHDTAWQRGFQAGVNSSEKTAKDAVAALEAEKVAHRETNRMMTEALMQSDAQQVAVPQSAIKEIVVNADYREMWAQQVRINQGLCDQLAAPQGDKT